MKIKLKKTLVGHLESAHARFCEIFIFSLLGFGLALSVGAQPVNDNFANRIALTGKNLSVHGCLSNATLEAEEPLLPGISSGQTAWWTWSAPSNGVVTLSITATNFDPLLTVYTGSDLSKLSLVASNNYQICYSDGVCGYHWRERSQITFYVAKGQAYQMAVDSAIYTDASLQFQLIQVTEDLGMGAYLPTFMTNTLDGGNVLLSLQFTPTPLNDDFEHPIRLSGQRIHGAVSNRGATKQPGEPNHLGNPGGSSVWYSWTSPATGRVTLSTNNIPPYLPPSWINEGGGVVITQPGEPTCGDEIDQNPPPPFYPLLAAYTGTTIDSLVSANCLPMGLDSYPNAVEFDAVKGQTYRIAFDGNMGSFGDMALFLELTQPAVNDNFKGRIKLQGINLDITGYNAGATHESGEPMVSGSTGKSVWWSWTAPVSGTVSIDLSGSDYPFPVEIFSGSSLTNLNLVSESTGSFLFEATQGQTYQIAVEDSAGLTGKIKFKLQAPVVQLPLVGTPLYAASSKLLTYSATVRQVVLLQSSTDNLHWKTVSTATARHSYVQFYVHNAPHTFYRAIVVGYYDN